jgi:hypothetical protein
VRGVGCALLRRASQPLARALVPLGLLASYPALALSAALACRLGGLVVQPQWTLFDPAPGATGPRGCRPLGPLGAALGVGVAAPGRPRLPGAAAGLSPTLGVACGGASRSGAAPRATRRPAVGRRARPAGPCPFPPVGGSAASCCGVGGGAVASRCAVVRVGGGAVASRCGFAFRAPRCAFPSRASDPRLALHRVRRRGVGARGPPAVRSRCALAPALVRGSSPPRSAPPASSHGCGGPLRLRSWGRSRAWDVKQTHKRGPDKLAWSTSYRRASPVCGCRPTSTPSHLPRRCGLPHHPRTSPVRGLASTRWLLGVAMTAPRTLHA